MRQHEAARGTKLTTLSISDEARENAKLTANSATGNHQQAVAGRSKAQLNLDRTVLRSPVNGFVTNLTVDVGQYASVGTGHGADRQRLPPDIRLFRGNQNPGRQAG
jgi:multidrug resistance efflux pump